MPLSARARLYAILSFYAAFWIGSLVLVCWLAPPFVFTGADGLEASEPVSLMLDTGFGVPGWVEFLFAVTSSAFIQFGALIATTAFFLALIELLDQVDFCHAILFCAVHLILLCPYAIGALYPAAAADLALTYQAPERVLYGITSAMLFLFLIGTSLHEVVRYLSHHRPSDETRPQTSIPSEIPAVPELLTISTSSCEAEGCLALTATSPGPRPVFLNQGGQMNGFRLGEDKYGV